jgi:hypothetical protein
MILDHPHQRLLEVVSGNQIDKSVNLMQWWPVLIGLVTLIIILAKMHAAIEVLNEKVKVLFQIINK